MKLGIARGSLAALACVGLTACVSAGMKVPADLESTERLAVTGRGGWERTPVRFGDWQAGGLDRSWTRGSGMSVSGPTLGKKARNASQSYGFVHLAGEREVGEVLCEALGSRGTVGIGGLELDVTAREQLECTMTAASGEARWFLSLDAQRDAPLEGFLRHGDDAYALLAQTTGTRLIPGETRGFEVRLGGRVVAAVETVNAGAVWLDPSLSDTRRETLAGVALAILLYHALPTED